MHSEYKITKKSFVSCKKKKEVRKPIDEKNYDQV